MTYSIVALDPDSGELGIGVQSHWFSVGSVVPWARPGVGAVATQAAPEIDFGPRGLDLLASGATADEVVTRLLADDPAAASRQLGVVDAAGRAAAHTGSACVAHAGHLTGVGVGCQANMMAVPSVWPAMHAAFEASRGPLARRLLAALDAGEAEGGDLRGRQSAALLVVPASGEPWQVTVSLRVEDHPEPLDELRRLLGLSDAYAIAAEADELAARGEHAAAAEWFQRAAALAPQSVELRFWSALGAMQSGDEARALDEVRTVLADGGDWRELLARLPAELVPAAPRAARPARGERSLTAALAADGPRVAHGSPEATI